MAIFVSKTNTQGYDKIVLEEAFEGTYIFVYETPQSKLPEQDHLQDDTPTAREICRDDYGVPLKSWAETSD